MNTNKQEKLQKLKILLEVAWDISNELVGENDSDKLALYQIRHDIGIIKLRTTVLILKRK